LGIECKKYLWRKRIRQRSDWAGKAERQRLRSLRQKSARNRLGRRSWRAGQRGNQRIDRLRVPAVYLSWAILANPAIQADCEISKLRALNRGRRFESLSLRHFVCRDTALPETTQYFPAVRLIPITR